MRRAGPRSKFHPQIQKQIQRGAHTKKYKNTYREARALKYKYKDKCKTDEKDKNTTKKTIENTKPQKNNVRNPDTPEDANRWVRTFGPHTRRFFFFCGRACLCKYDFVGMNRQDDVREFQTLIFVACQQLCDSKDGLSKLCVLSNQRQKTRRRLSPAAMYANTQLLGSRHQQATCLMLITVRSQNMCRTCFILRVGFPTKEPAHAPVRPLRPAPQTSCARSNCVTDVDVFRTSPTSLLVEYK